MHGFSSVKRGRRRRYRCTACGKTFGATTGMPYKRLQHPRREFDRVASLRVEGVSKAAIARIEDLSWNTVTRWLELAAAVARKFNEAKLRGFDLEELQLHELITFLANRNQKTWVFAGIEVSSRLWLATLVGTRGWRNTRLQDALEESEDSSKLNTAFIERWNLTIRRGSAYLNRRSPCHAREKRTLGGPSRAVASPRQLLPPSQRVEVRASHENPSNAGGLIQEVDAPGHLRGACRLG